MGMATASDVAASAGVGALAATRARSHRVRAGDVRPPASGVGRSSSTAAEAVSDTMRLAGDALTRHRRQVAALNLGAIAALLPVAAYQTGLLHHLPEPPLPYLDADRVDASGEAYVTLHTADAPLGIASYAVTVALAAMGAADRAHRHPWLVLAFAGKVSVDALGAAGLTLEQLTKHHRFCGYCLLSSALAMAAVPAVLPEARAALRSLPPLLRRS